MRGYFVVCLLIVLLVSLSCTQQTETPSVTLIPITGSVVQEQPLQVSLDPPERVVYEPQQPDTNSDSYTLSDSFNEDPSQPTIILQPQYPQSYDRSTVKSSSHRKKSRRTVIHTPVDETAGLVFAPTIAPSPPQPNTNATLPPLNNSTGQNTSEPPLDLPDQPLLNTTDSPPQNDTTPLTNTTIPPEQPPLQNTTNTTTTPPPNQPPLVHAGNDQMITLPQTLRLEGIVSDDGSKEPLIISWSLSNGPAPVTFSNQTSEKTMVTFRNAGNYTFQLTANDGEFEVSDSVIVVVFPAIIEPLPLVENHPPMVSAGQDQAITLPDVATLQGSATDDGLPSNRSLISQWEIVRGPGNVLFANPDSLETEASFSQSGEYVIRLTVFDSEFKTSDELMVMVHDAPAPQNQAPTVHAGNDQVVTLPSEIYLQGNISDDSLPLNHTLIVQWEVIDGPSPVLFSNASAAGTYVRVSQDGEYVFRLHVSDGELESSDEVIVRVNSVGQPPSNEPLRVLFRDSFGAFHQWRSLFGERAATILNNQLQLQPVFPYNQSVVVKEADWHNYTFQVFMNTQRQMRLPPTEDTVGSVIFRYADLKHYYFVAITTNGVELGKYHGSPQKTSLAFASSPRLELGHTYNLTITANDNHLMVSIDGTLVIDTFDPNPLFVGGIGLASDDAEVYFDNVVVQDLDHHLYPIPRPQQLEAVEVWWDEILEYTEKWNLGDPYLLAGIIKIESWFNETVYNAAERAAYEAAIAGGWAPPWYEEYYGKGLTQVTGPWTAGVPFPRQTDWSVNMPATANPATAPRMNNAYNGRENIDRAGWYLRALIDLYNGDVDKAISAYHFGWQGYDPLFFNPPVNPDPHNNWYTLFVRQYQDEYEADSKQLEP